jgi:hypothetical protein
MANNLLKEYTDIKEDKKYRSNLNGQGVEEQNGKIAR